MPLDVLAGGAALHAARRAGEEAQVVGHHRDLVAEHARDRLARVDRLLARQLLAVLLDRVGEPEQRLGARRRRRLRPALERALGGGDRGVDVGGLRQRRLRDLLAGGGVQHRLGRAARGRAEGAVDEVLERAHRDSSRSVG